MLEALRRYYTDKKILSTKFDCPHMTACKSGNLKFAGPASAFVSTGYERRTLPRLLVLSPDSGKRDAKNLDGALPLNMREWGERVDIMDSEEAHGGHHWFRTHELAWYILRRFDPELPLKDVNKYFAHTNAAKCCENNPGGRLARGTLFDNCREFLPGELDVLSPDILITQGGQAEAAILLSPASYDILGVEEYSSGTTVRGIDADEGDDAWYGEYASSKYLRKIRNLGHEGHDLFWLHTWHPTPKGETPFWGQIDLDPKKPKKGDPNRCRGWNRYGDIVADWWKREYGDLKV